MLKQTLMQKFILSLCFFSAPSFAATEGWLEAIAKGKDLQAAEILEEYRRNLPENAYSSFTDLVDKTIRQLRDGFNCADHEKITLYRRMQPGTTDVELPREKRRILFPSRAFMTKDRKFNSSGLNDTISRWALDSMKSSHSHPLIGNRMYDGSYLVSTTNGDGVHYDIVPSYTVVAAVLRVCPERAIPGRFGESEVLLPFFIHPNEVVAVIEMTDNKEFSVHYRGFGMSEQETRDLIIKFARDKAEEKAKRRSCANQVVH